MAEKIVKAEALDEDSGCISVELANGSIIILELSSKLGDPLFAEIKELSRPRTDGERVYWGNGASLTLEEVLNMLTDEADSESEI